MRIQGIIHQNIRQLKWHILASLAVIMVLPVEEFIVGLKDGFGFEIGLTVISSIIIAPLLAGLIGCANVQADLDERRYIFWRSKPAGVKSLIALKYFIGLVLSVFILACPIILWTIISLFSSKNLLESDFWYLIFLSLFFTIMTYSLCFLSNIVVRSTARSWLIGMLLAGFVLILPFFLPLGYKDYFDIYDSGGIFMIIVPVSIVFAFIFSLFAAQHDWHLKTNLKRLLWVIAGLVFVLLMLFSSQIANVKVLDEKEIEYTTYNENSMEYDENKVIFRMQNFINANNNKISLSNIGASQSNAIPGSNRGGYSFDFYPHDGILTKHIGSDFYSFHVYAHSKIVDQEPHFRTEYDIVTLHSYKYAGQSWLPVGEIDLSDTLKINTSPQMAMRLIENRLIVFVDNSVFVIDMTNPEDLQRIDTKSIDSNNNIFRNSQYYYDSSYENRENLDIPLISVEGISDHEKIKLGIDLYYHASHMYESSVVDIHNENITFCIYNYPYNKIMLYKVTGWDHGNIHCQLVASRQLTILEGLTHSWIQRAFVKDGKFYCQEQKSLMVFDIRSNGRIEKLGHFVRLDYEILDMAVLEDEKIVLHLRWNRDFGPHFSGNEMKNYLCLLEAP